MIHYHDKQNQFIEVSHGYYIYGDAAKLHMDRFMERNDIDYFTTASDWEGDSYFERCDINNIHADCIKLIAVHTDGTEAEYDIQSNLAVALINHDWDSDIRIEL